MGATVDRAVLRRTTISMGSRGNVINIVSWMLLAVVVCTLVARFAMKVSMKTKRRRFGLDDLFIALAALFSFGQTVVVSIESMRALGQHVHDLSAEQIVIYQKAEYVAYILYIANMGCARISICLVIRKVLPGTVPKYTALGFAGFTALWTLSGVIATAFACALPHPWIFVRNTQCYDVTAFVNYIGITNIIVEILLVLIPLVVWNVRISATRRISVSLVFLARLLVVAVMGVQLYFFNNTDLTDQTYARWPTVLSEQIAQNLAIITACLPVLNPFIIKIIAGKIEPEEISYTNSAPLFIKRYFEHKPQAPIFDYTTSHSSHASITPLTEKTAEPYCRPLATYGLDLSSNHRLTHSSSHFALNIAKPIFTPSPPENVFNRHINVPVSRPATSTSAKDPLAAPTQLDDVGVLPTLEWETESNSSGSRRSSPARHPTAEWVGIRQKVISVPEEEHLYDDESKRFCPPLPSPRCPKKPPRAF
ncbi:hypothetical protein HBI56_053860 [Parastagonospora nodorum]|uniref:Rhodopsin domain-containing protein n=1 Tax=Phaeosphaeria nodorum (strain SN15 / ATCC MYA-4574 / FGSC 10173) TaxID=321614 RepID=A0A7U2ICP4_PHANO|nr:hypothetical protein HBH56_098220 [Parastagonospora nodorum]QRD07360.1 hypothetical protein JI435_132450 [Parastagonospora nodorum SN15]KAH3930167.1 hypothetical protein HBH54_112540 [Parastagonospora nodorum]KAH3939004.1 hypothetical protein HBH53_242130 [Parastagonospora nodorum]KAH3964637.1 hypothetical protein HBH51_159480 [Parastagonospora nodorum]